MVYFQEILEKGNGMDLKQVVAAIVAVTELITGMGTSVDVETASEEIKQVVTEVAEETAEEELLDFVDVYGEHYEVAIHGDWKKHPYDYSHLNKDGDFYTYEDENYTSRAGIDVSKYQGHVDWQAVKDAGASFVFLRMGYRSYGSGELHLDPMFLENIEGAQAAGLDVGVYFFSQAINEAEAIEEADFVLSNLKGYTLTMPIVYDPETIRDDVARTDEVTGEQFTKNALAFCKEVEEDGRSSMVYCNMLWEAYELDLQQLEGLDIWYADYEPLPQTPYDYTIWQYSQTAHCPGVEGAVDKNLWLIKKEGN